MSNLIIPFRANLLESGSSVDTTFKITVDTTQSGSASDTFVLPLQNTINNFVVDWGDGNSETVTAVTSVSHSYGVGNEGTYQITLDGAFGGMRFWDGVDKLKLSSIDNWGTNQWSTMNGAFQNCSNMVANYSDAPDTSLVLLLTAAFRGCTNFNGVINFDTSNVTNTQLMFAFCSSFNSSITFSDSSNVVSMYQMFQFCTIFNQPITFSTASVANMNNMFSSCPAFNQNLNSLDFSSNINMLQFISNYPSTTGTYAFNNGGVAINWNTTLVSNMQTLFYKNYSLTVPVSLITNNVTTMRFMFNFCSAWNQDISAFNISSLTNAISMLASSGFDQTNYDLLLPAWDAYGTSNVSFHAGTAHYSAGAPTTAHDAMVSRGWTITDGGTP